MKGFANWGKLSKDYGRTILAKHIRTAALNMAHGGSDNCARRQRASSLDIVKSRYNVTYIDDHATTRNNTECCMATEAQQTRVISQHHCMVPAASTDPYYP